MNTPLHDVKDGYIEVEKRSGRRQNNSKSVTNSAVSQALASILVEQDTSAKTLALVLDSASGITSQTLHNIAGIRMDQIMSPNISEESVAALSMLGVNSYHGRIEDALKDFNSCYPCKLVYLDHCGAFPARSWQVRECFRKGGALSAGGIFACTFSCRVGNFPSPHPLEAFNLLEATPWSAAKTIYSMVQEVVSVAKEFNFEVSGLNIDGLNDYIIGDSDPATSLATDFLTIESQQPQADIKTPSDIASHHLMKKAHNLSHKILGEKYPVRTLGYVSKNKNCPSHVLTTGVNILDKDIQNLFSVRRQYEQHRPWPFPSSTTDKAPNLLLRKSVLLYPEQMGFLIVRITPNS
ncbi:hypothetical protein ScalyP_jg2954 [Parmales sp. scaly parma]|nr:hypothetical protein ScalyP_jg2954 [Parmales sp. scaly parma]